MAITKDVARQWPLVAVVDVAFGDLTSGAAAEAVDLPPGAVVTGGSFIVDTVWDSATSDVLDIGDGGDDDEYTSSQIDLTALGRTALTITGYEYTAADTVDFTWTGVGAAPSTGAGRLILEYIIADRANESQQG